MALMFCGIVVTYLSIRFSNIQLLQDTSSIIEVSSILFLLSLACIALTVKCSTDLKRVAATADNTKSNFKDIQKYHEALFSLTKNSSVVDGLLSDSSRVVTETLTQALAVERASIWLLNESGTAISCLDLHCQSTGEHSIPKAISIDEYPEYFKSLDNSRSIGVSDALTDKRTKEICKNYLIPRDIRSTIDSPIRVSGKVVGYIFVSCVGERREWSSHDSGFIAAIADQFAQVVVSAEKRKMYESLHEVMSTTSSLSGKEFFDMLVCKLCSVLNVEFAMVTKWVDGSNESMKSMSLGVGGTLSSDMEYKLEGTPCNDVVQKGFMHVRGDAISLYPEDEILVECCIESYMGTLLFDSNENAIGILNVFHTAPIPQEDIARTLLEIFASRAAIELVRMETLEELNANKALLNATLDSTADGIMVANKDGEVMLANKRFAELWGIPSELVEEADDDKMLEHAVGQLLEPDRFLKKVQDLYNSDRDSFDVVFFKDGRMFERYSRPLMLDGAPAGRVWSFRDITVKERAVASLQESEDRYHSIFDSSNDGLIIFDSQGEIKEANRAASRMHGWSEVEFLKLQPHEFIHKNSLPVFQEFLERLATDASYQCVARDICKDGSIIDIEVSGVQLSISGEIHYLGVVREVTERKRRERQNRDMQEKLERAERMQSIGALAGGVAHDLNNILGPLVAYPELILMKLPADSPLRGRIELIGKSAKHAAEVIQDLLTLARRGRVEMQPGNMNSIVKDVMLSTNFVDLERRNTNVKVTVNLETDLGIVNVSKSHLAKAILNLCANAFKAMPSSGELTIETTQVYLERLLTGDSGLEPGDYVGLRIRDTGEGMTKEHLSKLFEPYYNRNHVASSTSGLGLSIVYGVIKDHSGYYDVMSEVDRGTEFIIYLPIVTGEVQPEYLKPSNYRGSETILVVDDDGSQRDLACALLESLGYDVVSASNGEHGVEILKARPSDIVVLDMIMEDGFDGLDTYREMLKSQPHQKAVIVTGFAATDRVDEMHRLGAGTYVRKPYSRDSIGKAVRETLDRAVHVETIKA